MLRDEKYLPAALVQALAECPERGAAEELRLRAGRAAMLYAGGREFVLDTMVSKKDIEETVLALSGRSLCSFAEEIRQGFFTVAGGVRIGLAGRVIAEGGEVRVMRDFTSLNIRFPREFKGISRALMPHITVDGRLAATLIASAPQHGKTTLLRDIVRAVSAGEGVMCAKCAVIDERMEVWGGGSFDLGPRTDVLSGCPKHIGLAMALRSLSPDILATDEIGGAAELGAITEAANSGVRLLATAHAWDYGELMSRPFFAGLLASRAVERVVLLSESLGRGTVERVLAADGTTICDRPFRIGGAAC